MTKSLLSLRKWTLLLCLPFVLLSSVVRAQASAYTFTQSVGTYTEIVNGGNLVTATSGTSLDTYNKLINLPFSFPFNGVNHTKITFTGDGAIYLNPTLVSNSTSPFTQTAQGVISAFGCDLRGYYNTNHVGTVDTVTTEIGGERVYIIQQKNWSCYNYNNTASSYQVMNFQYHLYESGKIEIVYGNFTRVGTSTLAVEPFVGLRGATQSDINIRTNTTSQSFNASTAGTLASNTQKVNFTANNTTPGLPTNGLTYTWTPPACVPITAATSNITTNSATITFTSIQATVFNYEIRTAGAAGSGTNGLAASGQTASLTELVTTLTPGTVYTLYAQGVCGSDLSNWSVGVPFTTQCTTSTLPLFEGFNSTTRPVCWTSALVSGSTSYLSYPATGSNPSATPQESSNMVQYNSFSSSNGNQERLISPTIDASGIANIMTEFKFFKSNDGTQTDSLILQYSIDNGTTWTRFGGVARVGVNGWVTQSHSLPAAAGNNANLKVGFLFKSAYGYKMYIDSVVIKEIPAPTYTSISNFNVCSFNDVTATINGINLANANVSINGNPVVVLTNTFSQITFKVPTGTTGTVSVTTPLGTFDIAQPLTIITPPDLTLTENTTTVCASTPFIVTLDSDIANYSTYTWNTNSSNTATGDAANGFELSTADGYTFIITGTTTINDATCTHKDTLVVSTIALPNLAQNFATAVICDNDQKQLSFNESQGTITTTGTTISTSSGAPNPFSSHYGGLKTQSIYTAADLIQMGWTAGNPITGITINTITVNPTALNNFRVRMGTTTASTMTTTFIIPNNEVIVYQGTFQPVLGLNTINFTTPYIWDGTSNVVLEFAHNNSNSGSSTPFTTIQNISTPTVTSAHYYVDGTAAASTESTIYNRTTATYTQSRRILLNFLAETPLVPVTEDYTISWTGTNLYLDAQGLTPYTNEASNTVFFIPTNGVETATPTVSVTNEAGCTRTLSYAITINSTFETILTQEACNFFEYRGNILSNTGVYRDTLASIGGCDSIVVLNLNITNSTNNYVNHTACGSYLFNGNPYTTSGVYTATFQTANGCDSTVILNLSIINQVAAYITFSGDTLFAHPSFEDVTYQWENCNTGQVIPGANQATFIPQEYGIYRVRVGTGTCVGTSICAVYGVNGIEIVDDLALSAYPNPTKGSVTINYASDEAFDAMIIDATGQIIAQTKVLSGSKVDLSAFAPGVYTIKLGNDNTSRTVRVIKH